MSEGKDLLESLWDEVIAIRAKTNAKPLKAIPSSNGKYAPTNPVDWPTVARAIQVSHQLCATCGRTHSSVDGQFVKQEYHNAIKYVARVKFTSIDLTTLPLELIEFNRTVQYCYECILTEQLIDAAMRCDLGHHQLELL